jgi:hypothetical protein
VGNELVKQVVLEGFTIERETITLMKVIDKFLIIGYMNGSFDLICLEEGDYSNVMS